MTSTVLTFPLDLVRTRLTVQTTASADSRLLAARYTGMFHCLFSIWKEEGFFALYKGMGVSLLGIVPYVAINYASYETIKQFFAGTLDPYVFGGVFGKGGEDTLLRSSILKLFFSKQSKGASQEP